MDILISGAITTVLLFLFGLWLRNYLPSYFSEKGKLLAQKEDIAEVTQKIEAVKDQFAQEAIRLNAELRKLTDLEVSYIDEERNAIIKFYEKYYQWLYSIHGTSLNAFDRNNVDKLTDRILYIESFYESTCIAQSGISLFVTDEEIVVLSMQLIVSVIKFGAWSNLLLIELRSNFEGKNVLRERELAHLNSGIENKPYDQQIIDKENELKREYEEIIRRYNGEKVAEFSKTIDLNNRFCEAVKKYLRSNM